MKTDGATEMCSCFYEERMMGKQRAALTIKAELFVALHPKTRRTLFIINTLDARGLSSHIITSLKNSQGARLRTQGCIILACSSHTASENDIKPLGRSHLCT